MGTLSNCSISQENVQSEFSNAEVLYLWNRHVTPLYGHLELICLVIGIISTIIIIRFLILKIFKVLKPLRKLNELQDAVGKGNKKKIKEICNWFHQDLVGNKKFLSQLYKNHKLWKVPIKLLSYDQCPTQNDLILAACRTKRADILFYILNETDILVHLSDDSFDDTINNNQRTEVFKTVLNSSKSNTFKMVEFLYDYWCGNLHGIGYDLNNIKSIGKVLMDANNVLCADKGELMVIQFLSLIKFNIFQQEVYTELAKLNTSDETPEKTATMILKVLQIYHTHSEDCETEVYLEEDEQTIKDHIEAKGHFIQTFRNSLWTIFFRKLDLNTSLLILENIYIIRKHLRNCFNKTIKYFNVNPDLENDYRVAANLYKEFESELYHFIHRTSENWYMYSYGDMSIAMVRYLERKRFKKSLKEFENILKVYCKDTALDESGTQSQPVKKLLDENYLQPIEYMRDHYSLTKVVKYIEAVQKTKDMNFLMMERVLQVIGEMFKSTDDSDHLSRSTQALLQIAISVETVRHLHKIRDFLSKVKKGQLDTRINIENTIDQKLYDKIKEELETIKRYINCILDIHNFILDKSLFKKNYDMLEEQTKHIGYGLDPVEYRQFNEDEIAWIEQNKNDILSLIQSVKTRLLDYVAMFLPSYLDNAKKMLGLISENYTNVKKQNKQLELVIKKEIISNYKISDWPNDEEIYNKKNKVEKWNKRNKYSQVVTDSLSGIKNYKPHWDSIKSMLKFCITECELMTQIHVNLNEDSLPDEDTVEKVNKMVENFDTICETRKSEFKYTPELTMWYGRIASSLTSKSTNFEGIEKLVDYFKDIKQDDPRIARKELLACLIERLNLLKQTLLYPQQISLNQHVRRFNNDLEFRIILEMILVDIANVLGNCDIKLMYKSSKFLTGIDLGNVLGHGNPFLDVISIDLKSDNFAAELVEKAMIFAEDAESIEALYKLFIDNVDYATITTANIQKLTATQKILFEQFVKSKKWRDYAELVKFPRIK